jgi:cytochrome c oxidase cbb3-type subunit 2
VFSPKNVIIGLAFLALVLGVTTLTITVPAATFNPEPTPGLVNYTPAQARGREIYQREGCYTCHSQFIRVQDYGFGPLSQSGDYAYDQVNLLGTLRNGPDLSWEGGLYPDEWHIGHLKNPRAYLPGSVMPSFSYLPDDDIRDLVAYIQSLGTRNTKAWQVRDVNIAEKYRNLRSPFPGSPNAAAAGRGIYNQNCAACHGFDGRANTPIAKVMYPKPPADFHLPRYRDFTDGHWFNKVAQGVPGTRMPRWELTLNEEQIWYVVEYLKELAADQDLDPKEGRAQYYTKEQLQPGDQVRDETTDAGNTVIPETPGGEEGDEKQEPRAPEQTQ